MTSRVHQHQLAMLCAEYVSVPDGPSRRPERILRQRQPWLGSDIVLTLFNGHFLACQDRLQPQTSERVVNLAYLDARPRWSAGNLRQRLSLGAALVLPAFLAGVWSPAWAPALLVGLSCLFAWLVMSARPSSCHFYTALAGVPVCRIDCPWWQQKAVMAFIEALQERIDGARVVLPSGRQRLAAELAEHRRMLVSGGLSRQHYESARARLLQRLQQVPSEMQLA